MSATSGVDLWVTSCRAVLPGNVFGRDEGVKQVCPKSKVQSPLSKVQSQKSTVPCLKSKGRSSGSTLDIGLWTLHIGLWTCYPVARFALSRSTNTRRGIFPDGDLGICVTNSTCRIRL